MNKRGPQSLEVCQFHGENDKMKYGVDKAVNILTPKVGDVLTESEVESYINRGVKVTITSRK
jgi:hypothetical protein